MENIQDPQVLQCCEKLTVIRNESETCLMDLAGLLPPMHDLPERKVVTITNWWTMNLCLASIFQSNQIDANRRFGAPRA
jgi:hypothetical protein